MKEVGKQTDSGIKLSVIGIHGAGKTTLAVGLYGRAKERGDYCEPINRDSIDYLKRMSNVLNEGRIPPTKGGRHPIELMYHCGDSETRLDFFDYMGEDSSHKQSLDGLIKRDDCGGVVILVNPQHFESSQKREENETLIRNAAESIKSAKNIRYVALVMTACDWFVNQKNQGEIQEWYDGLRDTLQKETGCEVHSSTVTVYGFKSDGKPNLDDNNNAYEPFSWIVSRTREAINNENARKLGDKIDSQIEKIRDNTARQKIAVKVLSFVGMIVAVVVAWMGIKLVQSRNIQPSVDPQAKNGDMVGQGEGKAKIAELEEEKKRKESELADIRAESECVKCISDMREKLHSRYGVFGAVDCFNTFCSEHSDAMASSHATNVVRLLHRTIGDEFLRICAVITNQNWQFGLSCGDKCTESHSPDALDKSFQELKELAFKVGRIKNDDAAKSCWIEFAQKCKPWLTRLDEAFALNYEVTKIEAMMDYEEVSKYFWNITFYAPEIVRLKSTEGGLVKWERCDVAPIKLDVDTIKTNRVWQTVWEGSVTTAGNPWRDAGLLMSIRDYGWGRYETTAFVVPLYGAGERKNATDGARVVEKRIRMPLKDNSKSKEPYVRVRVYVNDSAADSSAANLFSLLPDDTKQGRR